MIKYSELINSKSNEFLKFNTLKHLKKTLNDTILKNLK